MVNEFKIPIENKRPVETVYELKDQVPSFEEFMKTYESDGSLNYADLSGGSVGEVKGYGPCSSSTCTCYLYHEEGFVPLNSSCPACSGNTAHQWRHSWCGNSVYISRNIRIKCISCGTQGHWKEWSFQCEKHSAREVKNTSSKVFLTALTIAAGMRADDSTTMDIIADIGIRLLQDAKRGL